MVNCPKCNELVEDGKNYCPNCGNNLTQRKKSIFPTVSGILLIIASVFCLVAGIFFFFRFVFWFGGYYNTWVWLVAGILLLWAFSIGLTAGILTLKRKYFALSMIGASFIILGGCIDLVGTIILGIVILIMSIIGLIFGAISKKDFQRR